MRRHSTLLVFAFALSGGLLWAGVPRAKAGPLESNVTGTLMIDGKAFRIEHAYVDETDADEPIVVLSDKPLPPKAIPFLSQKLVEQEQVHAVAFSVSRKDKALTNTFGKISCPGHEVGVGLGRVEDGNTKLTVKRLDSSAIEGTFATTKTIQLSFVTYSFDLTFRVVPSPPKK